jgi:hypothetical protein
MWLPAGDFRRLTQAVAVAVGIEALVTLVDLGGPVPCPGGGRDALVRTGTAAGRAPGSRQV